jgi:uncharacterized protein with HEPN domain
VSRDPTDFLQDIQDSCQRIVEYTTALSRDEVFSDKMRIDGILFNFQIIGEAVKNLPIELRETNPDIPWKQIAGMRDLIAHAYFALDLEILWLGIQSDIPLLLERVKKVLSTHRFQEPSCDSNS